MLTLLMAAALAAQDAAPDCNGNTQEIAACLSEAVREADLRMKRYHDAALANLTADDRYDERAGLRAAAHLVKAQRAFMKMRKEECAAVYDDVSGGTIRYTEPGICALSMTNARTYSVWERWLTYPDGSDPILPEPEPINPF